MTKARNNRLTAPSARAENIRTRPSQLGSVSILGIRIVNASMQEAISFIEKSLTRKVSRTQGIYIVNAHTLNLAAESPEYRRVLDNAHAVFGDGTGVRWAARLRGVRMKANLVGTDLIPELFQQTAGRGFRYFLLGANAPTIAAAAQTSAKLYPGWELVGAHHGYVGDDVEAAAVIAQINNAQPHVLLVGMGNPLQESWIHTHGHKLRVPVSIGVGGLFDHWGGNLTRAPSWVRRHGFEWLQLMLQQPHKSRRYLLGNPKFLMRIARAMRAEHVAGAQQS
ncbi:MAG: WecB/TagA/CpsF family glycosyltransferase [Betaproteobacteria bacterium]